jgi:hypothetical protein
MLSRLYTSIRQRTSSSALLLRKGTARVHEGSPPHLYYTRPHGYDGVAFQAPASENVLALLNWCGIIESRLVYLMWE